MIPEWDRTPEIIGKEILNPAFSYRYRLLSIYKFLNRLPLWSYPGGVRGYYQSIWTHGQEAVFAPHNLWRSLWHLMTGFLLLSPFSQWWAFYTLVGLIALKEVIEMMIGDKHFHWKMLVDILMWGLGGLVGILI